MATVPGCVSLQLHNEMPYKSLGSVVIAMGCLGNGMTEYVHECISGDLHLCTPQRHTRY